MIALSGRPPTFVGAHGHWRTGLVKGAIYGGVFMFLVLTLALPLRDPAFIAFVRSNALAAAPLAGALIFPLIQTLVGSADGTPPFFGRLRKNYRDPRAYARGVIAGSGAAWALAAASTRLSGRRSIRRDVRGRRAGLRRRRCRLRRGAHLCGANGASCGPGGSTRSAC